MRPQHLLTLACIAFVVVAGSTAPAAAQGQGRSKAREKPRAETAQENRRANAEKHFKRGREFEAQGKHAAAEAQYRAALKIDPTYTEARARLGVTRQNQGDPKNAAQILGDILSDDPKYTDGHVLLADALFALGDFAEAWRHVHEAERQGATPPDSLRKKLQAKYPEPPQDPASRSTLRRTEPAPESPDEEPNQGKGQGHDKKH